MTRALRLLLLGLFAALAAPGGRSEAQVVVVELFTSQGCSSCPPADALLNTLAADPDILALSLHVDYWDYLGWRDRFGRPENTRRQKLYAKAVQSRSIYTPQAIVQGADRLVGSNEAGIRAAIAAHRARPVAVRLELSEGAESLSVRVEPVSPPRLAERGVLHLVTYDHPQSILIEQGENAGRTITYVNVVRDWMKLGFWDGIAAQTFTAPLPGMGKGVAVILQDGTVGAVIAAARLEH